VHPNRAQPRTRFEETALDELASSIKELGVVQPIVVRKRAAGGFEIIAGERRWRAAQRAGLREVPIVVSDLSGTAAFEAAIVENLQREDLNPVETARAFQRLIDDYKHSQDTIAQKIGKDRSTIANALRLLKLPPGVLEHIENGELSEGHGRALLTAPSTGAREKLAKEAIAKQWSVRELERQARGMRARASRSRSQESANVRDLEIRLSQVARRAGDAARQRRGQGRDPRGVHEPRRARPPLWPSSAESAIAPPRGPLPRPSPLRGEGEPWCSDSSPCIVLGLVALSSFSDSSQCPSPGPLPRPSPLRGEGEPWCSDSSPCIVLGLVAEPRCSDSSQCIVLGLVAVPLPGAPAPALPASRRGGAVVLDSSPCIVLGLVALSSFSDSSRCPSPGPGPPRFAERGRGARTRRGAVVLGVVALSSGSSPWIVP
jgi:ParB family chromosome partitioning protein